MNRAALAVMIGCVSVAPLAWAEGASSEGEDGRYTFTRADDGYLRLDGRTGQVSMCTRRPVGWACQIVPDERAALEAELARLQAETVALKKELIARNLPLPGMVKPPVAKPDEPRVHVPHEADFDKVVNFVEKVWRRLVEMIAALQKDILKRT
jgi:hypothetical protein